MAYYHIWVWWEFDSVIFQPLIIMTDYHLVGIWPVGICWVPHIIMVIIYFDHHQHSALNIIMNMLIVYLDALQLFTEIMMIIIVKAYSSSSSMQSGWVVVRSGLYVAPPGLCPLHLFICQQFHQHHHQNIFIKDHHQNIFIIIRIQMIMIIFISAIRIGGYKVWSMCCSSCFMFRL